MIDHFSKWYNGYLLKTKKAKDKIIQVDNGTEFKNNLLKMYYNNKNIKLIHFSPYHPQTNRVLK